MREIEETEEEEVAGVLLVEDNLLDVHLVRAMLRATGLDGELEVAGSLDEAGARLAEHDFGIILLDLFLPDGEGLDALRQMRMLAPETPIVVLTGQDDRFLALQAVRDGAQDYLHKEGLDGEVLARAIRYGIERNRLMAEIRAMSLRDELTGLYNRRGFHMLAEQQMRLAARKGRGIAVVFADLDGMKEINDELGHAVGDRAIQEVADLLRGCFRNTDIAARLGGDEFVVMALEVERENLPGMLERVDTRLEAINDDPTRQYPLSVSIGMILYDPSKPRSLEEVLAEADAEMYARKRARGRGRRSVSRC